MHVRNVRTQSVRLRAELRQAMLQIGLWRLMKIHSLTEFGRNHKALLILYVMYAFNNVQIWVHAVARMLTLASLNILSIYLRLRLIHAGAHRFTITASACLSRIWRAPIQSD